jgi:hypothetical protein
MVQLEQRPDTAIAEAGQNPELPERVSPVEQALIDPGRGLQELDVAAGGWDRRLVNMVLDGESIVVHPERPASQRSRKVNTSSQLWDLRHTTIQPVLDLLQSQLSRSVQQCLAFEDGETTEVTGPYRRFAPKVHELERAETGESAAP